MIKNQADGYRLRRAVRTMIDRRTAHSGMVLQNEAANIVPGCHRRGGAAHGYSRQRHLSKWYRRKDDRLVPWRKHWGDPLPRCSESSIAPHGAAVRDAVELAINEDKTIRITANCTAAF